MPRRQDNDDPYPSSGSITRRTVARRSFLLGGGAALGGLLLPAAPARSEITITLDRGNFQPLPIAVTDFGGSDPISARRFPASSPTICARSGVFAPIDKKAFVEKTSNPDVAPQFDSWKVINAQALVTGRITRDPSGRLRAEFRLWDVYVGQQLTGQQYFTDPNNWRRVAHIISDAIYARLTGEKGFFDSRIVFVDETGPKDNRRKRLALMDQDGANLRYLTRGDDLVVTPRFSPSSQEVTYMSFGSGDPRVYLLNIETGQREVVGNFRA